MANPPLCGEYTPAMAGIFGVCYFDDRPVDSVLVARMSETLAHRGPDGEGLAIGSSYGLGCRMLRVTPESRFEAQPVSRPSGTCLVFDGRLDNREDLIQELRRRHDVSPKTPDAELAASAYEAFGLDFAGHLAGDFSLAVFDRREHRVVLARDAIGIRPLYYRRTPASVWFASEIKTLLVDPQFEARPNDRLLAELMLGHLHRHDDDGSTLFDGIHGVPPAHVAIFSEAQTVTRRYWDFDGRSTCSGTSFDECAEGFRHHFQRAVERRLRTVHPVAVAVSGGLDSSSIFCLASRSADAPLIGLTSSTRDGQETDESAFIADLERACGRAIQYVEPAQAGMLFRAEEVIRRTETPLLDGQWFRSERLLAEASAGGARTLLTGHWGDQVLFDSAYLVDLLHSGSWLTVRAHLKEYLRWFPDADGDEFTRRLLADLLEYDLPRWVRRGLRAARGVWKRAEPWDDWYAERFRREAGPDVFGQELSRTATADTGSGATVLARALYREVRSRYHALCLEWNNKIDSAHGVEPAFPFLDRDLLAFLMGVPGTVLVQDGVPKALLRGALSGTVPDSILRRRTKGDFTASVNDAARRDYQAVVKFLGPDSLVVQLGYVDAEKLTRGLAALDGAMHGSMTCVPSWHLMGLVALELWLRQFMGIADADRRTPRHDKTTAA